MGRPARSDARPRSSAVLRLRFALLYFAVLLLVCAIIFTLSLMFADTGYGLTRFHDLGGHVG